MLIRQAYPHLPHPIYIQPKKPTIRSKSTYLDCLLRLLSCTRRRRLRLSSTLRLPHVREELHGLHTREFRLRARGRVVEVDNVALLVWAVWVGVWPRKVLHEGEGRPCFFEDAAEVVPC